MGTFEPCTRKVPMAWEARGNRGAKFYYTGSWVGGRCAKRYLGKGPLAEVAAGMDAAARARRTADVDAVRDERARLDGPERALRALDEACGLLLASALTVAGYHRRNYCRWRPRRGRPASARTA
jgi:hypothetical protein